MQQNNANPFADKRTVLAIILFVVFLYGWNAYLAKKYPNYGKTQNPQVDKSVSAVSTTDKVESPVQQSNKAAADIEKKEAAPAKEISFISKDISFSVSSRGMGLKNVLINKYSGQDQKKIQLGLSDDVSLFEARLLATQQPINFDFEQKEPGLFVGVAKLGEAQIKRTLKYNENNSSFENSISILNANSDVARGIVLVIPEQIHTPQSTSFLFPSYEYQDFSVSHSGKFENINFSTSKEDIKKEFKTIGLVSIGSQYFTMAVLDKSGLAPDAELKSNPNTKTAVAEVVYKPAQPQNEYSFSQILYAGPKSIDVLQSIDAEMATLINFGSLAFIAKPLLFIMKWFHGIVGNWGFSIILLTLLVRFAVLPFNLMSMRSMKAMQKIQPKINALRDKYKDDPMTLNREMMQLMKENKANPLGGCLPMLLQIPIFFALYRVIGSSIELYQSPFVGWITDLSAHDKFYVLPVFMGITMYVQQKMTPTTMDPAQAKVMAFLPLIFTVFMLQLPSGLTLYMFVSAVFGIIQQWVVLKDSSSASNGQALKA